MSGCPNVGHPGKATVGHNINKERMEVLQVCTYKDPANPGDARGGNDTGWDVLGLEKNIGLEWSVWRAMVLEDTLRVIWIIMWGVTMLIVSKYTVPVGVGVHRVIGEWELGWGQYISWYWGVLFAIWGGLWVRGQLIWWERKVVREARQLWELYGFWDWVVALECIERKWLLGMSIECLWIMLWGNKPVIMYEVGEIGLISQVNGEGHPWH